LNAFTSSSSYLSVYLSVWMNCLEFSSSSGVPEAGAAGTVERNYLVHVAPLPPVPTTAEEARLRMNNYLRDNNHLNPSPARSTRPAVSQPGPE